MRTIHQWIRSLGVKEEQVYGLMPVLLAETQTIRLKFVDKKSYEEFMLKYEGQRWMRDNDRNLTVIVKPAGVKEKYVRISDTPFEVEIDEIREVLQEYGKVFTIKRETYMALNPEDGYFKTFSGWVTVRMSINKNIPSFLMLGGERVSIKYHGQIPTCRICNQEGHYGHACPGRRVKNKMENGRFPGKWAQSTRTGEKSGNEEQQKHITNEQQRASQEEGRKADEEKSEEREDDIEEKGKEKEETKKGKEGESEELMEEETNKDRRGKEEIEKAKTKRRKLNINEEARIEEFHTQMEVETGKTTDRSNDKEENGQRNEKGIPANFFDGAENLSFSFSEDSPMRGEEDHTGRRHEGDGTTIQRIQISEMAEKIVRSRGRGKKPDQE